LIDGKHFTENIAEISDKLVNGHGDLATLLNDSTITIQLKEAGTGLIDVTKKLDQISGKINRGEGDLGRLVNDEKITSQAEAILQKLDSVSATSRKISDNLLKASKQLNEGDGVLNRLLYDSMMAEDIGKTVVKVNEGLDEAKKAAKTIHKSWILNLFGHNKDRKKKNRD